MDMVITCSAYAALAIAALNVFFGPFVIGRKREPMGGLGYVINLVFSAIYVVLAGIALGWW
jgi:hypothetical protein